MKRKQISIKDRLDMESIPKQATPIIDKKEILKHPITKMVITGVAIYGFLYISKHFVNAFAGLAKAIRNAQHNLRR